MSKYRKPFLKLLSSTWLARFPSWQLGLCTPLPWAKKDATFTNTECFATSGRVFHAVIDFTPKWPGTFTADIVVADSLEPLPTAVPLRWPDDIPTLVTGCYRIGWFVGTRDIWWRLVDEAAESQRFWETVPGIIPSEMTISRHPDHWYARSYAVPFSEIMQEALDHFSDTFATHVIPKVK